jgi:DNA-binding transcriptional regulator PaaX
MGVKGKNLNERVEVGRIILAMVALAGLLSLAVAAPNAVQLLKMFRRSNPRHRSEKYMTGVIGKLQRRGLLDVKKNKKGSFVCLTKKGEWELLKYKLKEKSLQKRRWDGKWRVVIFDIKESRRDLRDSIRMDIVTFGFVRLQDSVWVYPYDCEDLIALLKVHCKIGTEVLYLLSEKVENDVWLRKKFKLIS